MNSKIKKMTALLLMAALFLTGCSAMDSIRDFLGKTENTAEDTGESAESPTTNAEYEAMDSSGKDASEGNDAALGDNAQSMDGSPAGAPGGENLPVISPSGEQGETETAAPWNMERDPEVEAAVEAQLAKMSLEDKISQLFFITPEALTGASGVTRAGIATREAIERYPVGGIVYFEENLQDPSQVREMLASTKDFYEELGYPVPFLSTDEEGGTVLRIGKKEAFGVEKIGNMADIGKTEDPEKAYLVGKTIGEYLADLGFNMDFAPVADVLTNPDNTVVAKRSFGANAELVSAMVSAESLAMLEEGVLPVLKHFPGHGATAGDTHNGYASTNKTLEELLENELVPFADSVSYAPAIMAAHISLPNVTGDDLPASLSKKMLTDVLRNELQFDGIILTDALNMGAVANQYNSGTAAVMAIEAGADMLLMPADFSAAYRGVLDAVESGSLSEDRIDESVRRILREKMRLRES